MAQKRVKQTLLMPQRIKLLDEFRRLMPTIIKDAPSIDEVLTTLTKSLGFTVTRGQLYRIQEALEFSWPTKSGQPRQSPADANRLNDLERRIARIERELGIGAGDVQ